MVIDCAIVLHSWRSERTAKTIDECCCDIVERRDVYVIMKQACPASLKTEIEMRI